MKKLKFAENLVPLVISGEKTSTWRLFDDKDLQVGDRLSLLNQKTGEEFAQAIIISVYEKSFDQIQKEDFIGHESFASQAEMLATYQSYYGATVNEHTIVKMIYFEVTQPINATY